MKNRKLVIGMKYGLVTSVLSILIGLALYHTGLAGYNSGTNFWTGLLIVFLGFYLASEQLKKENDGFMTFGEGIKVALWLGLSMGLITGIYAIINNYLDPSMMEKVMNQVEYQLEEQGQSQEQIDMVMEMTKWMTKPPVLIVVSVISNLFSSLIVALIAGNFLKKERPLF